VLSDFVADKTEKDFFSALEVKEGTEKVLFGFVGNKITQHISLND
jgi:hypothetical protein